MKQTLAILVFISVFCTSLFAVVVNDPDDPGDPGNPLPNLIQQLSLTPNTFDRDLTPENWSSLNHSSLLDHVAK